MVVPEGGIYGLFGLFVPRPVQLAAYPQVTLAVADTYAALASCLGPNGAGDPPLVRIVERTFRRSRTTVIRHLALLEQLELVTRYRRPGRPTRYQLERLVASQPALELSGYPSQLGDTGTRTTRATRVAGADPSQNGQNPSRRGDTTQRGTKDKTGDEVEKTEGDLAGFVAEMQANPYRHRRRSEPEPDDEADP